MCICELCGYHMAKTSIFGKHVSSVSLSFLCPALYIKKIAIDEVSICIALSSSMHCLLAMAISLLLMKNLHVVAIANFDIMLPNNCNR